MHLPLHVLGICTYATSVLILCSSFRIRSYATTAHHFGLGDCHFLPVIHRCKTMTCLVSAVLIGCPSQTPAQ